ncbi:unnamed protein product [Oikopleura dioica]|uniref:Uncharacterized protein n=1 Tax=Oikopleura dioica TaxID=34765 RepID=E4XDU0_OIKDI|nr:unnamed protein product [Oikopleura dioica]
MVPSSGALKYSCYEYMNQERWNVPLGKCTFPKLPPSLEDTDFGLVSKEHTEILPEDCSRKCRRKMKKTGERRYKKRNKRSKRHLNMRRKL